MNRMHRIKEILVGDSWLPYLFVALYAAVFFVVYGMGVGELKGNTALAQDLFAPLEGHYQSLYGSPLGPLLAHMLHIYSQTGYIALFLLIVALCMWALTRGILYSAANRRNALDALVLLALSPIMLLLYSWVGKTDPLIILSYLAFVLFRHPLVRNIAVACLLLAHEEIGALVLIVHFILNATDLRNWRDFLPGVFAGAGLQSLYHHLLPPYQDRLAFVQDPQHLQDWISNLVHAPIIAWAGFGWFWGVIGWAFWKRWLPRLTLAAAVAVPLAAAMVTSDTTRVIILVGFPLVWMLLKKYLEHGDPLPYKAVMPALVLSLVQSRYQTPEFRIVWSNWHTYPWAQVQVWKDRYL